VIWPSSTIRQPVVSDSDLDAFVESLANRIASFDKQAISETKRFADVASLPPDPRNRAGVGCQRLDHAAAQERVRCY
jgi:hypothetical protein